MDLGTWMDGVLVEGPCEEILELYTSGMLFWTWPCSLLSLAPFVLSLALTLSRAAMVLSMDVLVEQLISVDPETKSRLQSQGHFFVGPKCQLMARVLSGIRDQPPVGTEEVEEALQEAALELELGGAAADGDFGADATLLHDSWVFWRMQMHLDEESPREASASPQIDGSSSMDSEEERILGEIEEIEALMEADTSSPDPGPADDQCHQTEDHVSSGTGQPVRVSAQPEVSASEPEVSKEPALPEVLASVVPVSQRPDPSSQALADELLQEVLAESPCTAMTTAELSSTRADPVLADAAVHKPQEATVEPGSTRADPVLADAAVKPQEATVNPGSTRADPPAEPAAAEPPSPPGQVALGPPAKKPRKAPGTASEYQDFLTRVKGEEPVCKLAPRLQWAAGRALWHHERKDMVKALRAVNEIKKLVGQAELKDLSGSSVPEILRDLMDKDTKPKSGCPKCRYTKCTPSCLRAAEKAAARKARREGTAQSSTDPAREA